MAACAPVIGQADSALIGACHAQIGRAKHLTFKGALPHPPPPVASLVPGSAAYKAQIDQVLDVQAKLTDVQKIQVHRAWFRVHAGLHVLLCSVLDGRVGEGRRAFDSHVPVLQLLLRMWG